MSDLWSDLLACLDLDGAPPSFEGRNLPVTALRAKPGGSGGPPPGETLTYHRLFGGQLLAQCVQAASLACPGKALNWMRTPQVDPALGPALTAYATDLTLIGTALRPLDEVSQQDAGTAFTSAVTSHTLWFHRPVRTDGWLLLRQHSPLVAHGRCFGRGDVLTEDGSLVASYAQEALLRFAQ